MAAPRVGKKAVQLGKEALGWARQDAVQGGRALLEGRADAAQVPCSIAGRSNEWKKRSADVCQMLQVNADVDRTEFQWQ
jgi:hypothetical protein